MNPCETAATITAAAISIANQLCDDDLQIIAAAATQFGDTLTTISTQRSIFNAKKEKVCGDS